MRNFSETRIFQVWPNCTILWGSKSVCPGWLLHGFGSVLADLRPIYDQVMKLGKSKKTSKNIEKRPLGPHIYIYIYQRQHQEPNIQVGRGESISEATPTRVWIAITLGATAQAQNPPKSRQRDI